MSQSNRNISPVQPRRFGQMAGREGQRTPMERSILRAALSDARHERHGPSPRLAFGYTNHLSMQARQRRMAWKSELDKHSSLVEAIQSLPVNQIPRMFGLDAPPANPVDETVSSAVLHGKNIKVGSLDVAEAYAMPPRPTDWSRKVEGEIIRAQQRGDTHLLELLEYMKHLVRDESYDAALVPDADLMASMPTSMAQHMQGHGAIRKDYHEQEVFQNQYATEYALRLVHRMMLRRMAPKDMAKALNLSVSAVRKLQKELHRRLADEMRYQESFSVLAESNAFFLEHRAFALRLMDEAKDIQAQVLAGNLALKAETSRLAMLKRAGYFIQNPIDFSIAAQQAESLKEPLLWLLGNNPAQPAYEARLS